MPGAGSGTLLFGKESSFKGSVTDEDASGNPSYYHFGRNPTVEQLPLRRQLQRMREAGVIESVEAVAQNLEGAINVSAVVNAATFDTVEDVIFNDGGDSGFTTGQAQSAQVLVGAQYLDGAGTSNKIRQLEGAIPTQYSLQYNQGGMIRFSLNMLYADESDGSTPTDITSPTGGNDSAWHDLQLDIDATQIAKLQSFTFSIENLYRYHRGDQLTPIDAVLAAPQLSFSVTAIWDDPANNLEYAYGDTGDTTPQDSMTGQSAKIDVDVDTTDITQYDLSECKPDTYGWQDVLSGDTDTTETVEWVVNNGSSGIAIT